MSKFNPVFTAEDALIRYQNALECGALVQYEWQEISEDGRQLACALGVLGPQIEGPEDCPAAIMPQWVASMVPWFFDFQEESSAKEWGLNLYRELARLKGVVPFSVVHDWHANVVGPLVSTHPQSMEARTALMEMHKAALDGQKFTSSQWNDALEKAEFMGSGCNLKDEHPNTHLYVSNYPYHTPTLANGLIDALRRVPTPTPTQEPSHDTKHNR